MICFYLIYRLSDTSDWQRCQSFCFVLICILPAYLCLYVLVHGCARAMVHTQPVEDTCGRLFSPSIKQALRWNSDPQGQQQAPLPTEPSPQPSKTNVLNPEKEKQTNRNPRPSWLAPFPSSLSNAQVAYVTNSLYYTHRKDEDMSKREKRNLR